MVRSKNILLIILCLMIVPSSNNVVAECNDTTMLTNAVPIWSDIFTDATSLDDWYILGINHTWTEGGAFDVIDGALVLTGNNSFRNVAVHNSSIAFGTWSFDLFIDDQDKEHSTKIHFGTSTSLPNEDATEGYAQELNGYWIQIEHSINFEDEHGIYLIEKRPSQIENLYFDTPVDQIRMPVNLNKWFHFDITRYTSGNLYVYLDGEEILSYLTKLEEETSNTFSLWGVAGIKIDNISVYDSVTLDYHAPKFDTYPSGLEVELDEEFSYDMNATDDTDVIWTVDDTDNFEIDSDGVITNSVALDLGAYDIEVTAADESGNSNSLGFTLTVVEASGLPIPVEIFMSTLILIPILRKKLSK